MLTVETVAPGVRRLRLDDGAVNVMDLERVEMIRAAVEDAAEDAVILTGNGRALSAGVNLLPMLMSGPEHVEKFLHALESLLRTVFEHPRPVICAMNGHALAGGALLSLASDIRLMSSGTIGVTELLVGVPFPPGCTPVIQAAAGHHGATLMLTGAKLNPQRAAELGIVSEVFDTDEAMQERALAIATELADIPAEVYAITKAQLRRSALEQWDRDIPLDRDAIVQMWNSPNVREAMGRYAAKLSAAKAAKAP